MPNPLLDHLVIVNCSYPPAIAVVTFRLSPANSLVLSPLSRAAHPGRPLPQESVVLRGGQKWSQIFCKTCATALAMLVKNSGFSLIAIIMLTAGIGANIAVFGVVNAVLLKPLPVAQPDELVSV